MSTLAERWRVTGEVEHAALLARLRAHFPDMDWGGAARAAAPPAAAGASSTAGETRENLK